MSTRVLGLLALGLMALPGAAPAAEADGPFAAYDACSAIANPAKRLECFDAAQRARGHAPAPEAVQEERKKSFGAKPAPLASAKAKDKPQSKEKAQDGEEAISVELSVVGRTHDQKLWFRTVEGVLWAQTDTTVLRVAPRLGSSVKIKRAALGSYMCKLAMWVRCERTDQEPK